MDVGWVDICRAIIGAWSKYKETLEAHARLFVGKVCASAL
jgi:hypothetical protein